MNLKVLMIGIHRCKINQLVHYQTTSIHIICNEVNLKALVTGIHTLETILFSGTKGGMRVMLLFHIGITNQIHGLLNPLSPAVFHTGPALYVCGVEALVFH